MPWVDDDALGRDSAGQRELDALPQKGGDLTGNVVIVRQRVLLDGGKTTKRRTGRVYAF